MVTGGAGFIGSHVVERLVTLGHRVRIVDNLVTGDRRNLAAVDDVVDFVLGDLCDPHVCAHVVRDADVVFHLAALASVPRSMKDPWACHEANVSATLRLVQACVAAKVPRLVYSSSSSVYGDTPQLPKIETSEPLPRSPYAAAKLAGEQYVLAFARAGLFEAVALRYFNVFGPRQSPHSPYAAVIPAFLQAAREDRPAVVYGDGRQTRDFTYVANVVDANLAAAMTSGEIVSGAVLNVAGGTRTALLELLDLVRLVTGRDVACEYHPPRPGDVRDSLASLERTRQLLRYAPRIGLEEGLRQTWEWFAAAEAPAARPAVRRVRAGVAAGSRERGQG